MYKKLLILIILQVIFFRGSGISDQFIKDFSTNTPNTSQTITEYFQWIISSNDYNFTVCDNRIDNECIDGYYVLDGNDEFCFEIHHTEARWSVALEKYANMNNSENRKLQINNNLNNGEIFLSFEGQKLGSQFINCQEFYYYEKDVFVMYLQYCDEDKEDKVLRFVKQEKN